MYKIWASVKKESLLLMRDRGALVILFVMPLLLIITITLIQQGAFKNMSNARIPVIVVDNDNGNVSKGILENLKESGSFEVHVQDKESVGEEEASNQVFKGDYQMAIVIPENLSADLQTKVELNVNKILEDVGFQETTVKPERSLAGKEIRLYFDPTLQLSFKNSVKSSIDKMVSEIEVRAVYTVFQEQLSDSVALLGQEPFLSFKEVTPIIDNKEILPNATQHNVPAWTLFAIFFIVIPLSINLVKEKGQGTLVRLRTLPASYFVVILGKTITFLTICMLQFYLMVLVGVYLFPCLGLEPLEVEGKMILMSIVAFFSGLAAVGFGILLGTISQTQEQSSPFAATAVVIMAAVGGIWVPVFVMPPFMKYLAKLSPMNWGLNAFYDVLLRNYGLSQILADLLFLFVFFLVMIGISIVYDEKKRAI